MLNTSDASQGGAAGASQQRDVSQSTAGTRAHSSPSATQRMFYELSEHKPVDLPKHLRYKSPARSKVNQFVGASGRYMESKAPPPEPEPIQGAPDFERIHGSANHGWAAVEPRYLESKREQAGPAFEPLPPSQGVRLDPEVERMKELPCSQGFAQVESRYEQNAVEHSRHEHGESPREVSEKHRKERLGIHPHTFRPVSEVCAKTFDEYSMLAKIWKQTHGHSSHGDDEDQTPSKKMQRPSVVMEYVRHGTPILSRKGTAITPTGKEKARVEELRRRPRKEFHFVPTPHGGDFTQGPGSDRPRGYNKTGVKEAFNREREMITRLSERLAGHSTRYSPARLNALASVQRPPEQRLSAHAQQEMMMMQAQEQQQMQTQSSGGRTPRDNVSYHTRRLDMDTTQQQQQQQQQQQNMSQQNMSQQSGGGRHPTPTSGTRGVSPGVSSRARTPSRAGGALDGPQRPRFWR